MKFELEKVKSESYGEFEAVFLTELNKHAPLKKKFLRHNNNPLITKDLRKQIMVRSKLRNIFNKNRNHENWCKYRVSSDIVRKEIRNPNVKKSSIYGSIPASILKQCVDAYLPYLTVTINYSLRQNTFPEELKSPKVIPL